MRKRKWTLEEDNYIKENFGKITFSEMAEHLGCAIKTVENRALELGLDVEFKHSRRWTQEEIEILKAMAPIHLNKVIAEKLNRSLNELNKKARELGIELIFRADPWLEWMEDFLRDNINVLPISEIERMLGISYHKILVKCEELGIEYKMTLWREDEEEILRNLAGKVYIKEIAKVLDRTEGAVITKANKMGLEYITLKRKYSVEELQYIKDNWGVIPVTAMARELRVSRIMIQAQADSMNLPKLGNNPYRKWTDEEVSNLRELAKTMTISELASYYDTTNEAIITVAYRNKIDLIDSKVHWSIDDTNRLRELAKDYDMSEIARIMNRSTSAVRLQAERMQIKLMPNKKYADSVWTDENTQELKRLAFDGKTLLEIAIIMNKNDQTIEKKCREFNIKVARDIQKPWSLEEIEKLRELAKTKSIFEIVRILHRTTSSIKGVATKHKIKLTGIRKSWSEEEYQELERLVMIEKKSPKEIADILGRTEDAIIIKINRRGLQIQTNDKRFWTSEEETLLRDLWGVEPVEVIAEKLNRTVSSIKNKVFLLGLGSYLENNYKGLTLKEISELLNIDISTISIGWVSLGLKYKIQEVSKSTSYRYVEVKDLYDFLEHNQNIWDSRYLEENILGVEPDWLKEKRRRDKEENFQSGHLVLTKQQLILAKKFFLELKEIQELENGSKLVKKPE